MKTKERYVIYNPYLNQYFSGVFNKHAKWSSSYCKIYKTKVGADNALVRIGSETGVVLEYNKLVGIWG